MSTIWRYRVESFFGDADELEVLLNEIGETGWELVSVAHSARLGRLVCVFRRPREDES